MIGRHPGRRADDPLGPATPSEQRTARELHTRLRASTRTDRRRLTSQAIFAAVVVTSVVNAILLLVFINPDNRRAGVAAARGQCLDRQANVPAANISRALQRVVIRAEGSDLPSASRLVLYALAEPALAPIAIQVLTGHPVPLQSIVADVPPVHCDFG